MKKFDFKKIISYFNLQTEDGLEIKVARDWRWTVRIFVFILVLFFVFGGYVYWKKNIDILNGVEMEGSEESVINKKSLQEVLDIITEKEKRFDENLSTPALKDPSL